MAEIEVKNQLQIGDRVEFVSPHAVVFQTLTALYDLNHQPLSAAHAAHKIFWYSQSMSLRPYIAPYTDDSLKKVQAFS
jgi:hypothetical protein